MVILKKGEEFLIKCSIEELKQLYNKEKNAKVKLRYLAIILRKQNKTVDDISFSLQKPKTTIYDWLRRFEKDDISNINDKKQPGNPKKLNNVQLKKLKEILLKKPTEQNIPFVIWNTKLVQTLIIEKYKIKYQPRHVRNIVKVLGFSFQVPRQRNQKANQKAQEEFKKKLKMKYGIILNMDLRSSALMKRTLL